jgi:endoglycosylceramidase
VFEQSRITSERIGAVELVTEFGATDDVDLLTRVTALADEHLVGWQYWAYKEWNDPTTQSQGSGAQGLFADDADLSTAKRDKLMVLVRTYPMATAGVPESVSFDPTTGAFEYAYTAGDQATPTEIFVSPLHYDGCYEATVTGGTITSMGQAQVLTVEADAGSDVTVSVAAGSGCAPALGDAGRTGRQPTRPRPRRSPAAVPQWLPWPRSRLPSRQGPSVSRRSRTRRGSRRTRYGRHPR